MRKSEHLGERWSRPARVMLARTGRIAAALPHWGVAAVRAVSGRTDRRAGWLVGMTAGPASTTATVPGGGPARCRLPALNTGGGVGGSHHL